MKFEKLPICYRLLVIKPKNDEDKESEILREQYFVESEYHCSKAFKPIIFYKAVSKILAFGINKK